jgi:hypothetical protein
VSTEIELSPAGVQPEGKTPEHSDALRALRRIITELDAERASLVEAADLDKLAIGLSAIRTLIGDLRMLADATEANVVELMPQRRYEIEGLGTLERRKGTDRKAWEWESLWPLLVRPTLDPDGTGELPDLPTTVASLTSLTQEVIGLTPSKQPRVTALRAMGVDPDDWCEVSPGRTSVQIHGAAK